MGAYYNEFDAKAAAWLRELIKQGLIADGDVDTRDLWDVTPDDLRGYTQVHLCAGLGGWSYALRRAGWTDNRPVWTASFPCQPFSAAGKGEGFADERHLWPAGCHLIRECRPRVLFGEQVASKDAEPWLDLVQADLEALDYAFGACAFPAAGVGAPEIRDRLYWMADADDEGPQGWRVGGNSAVERIARARSLASRMADASTSGRREERAHGRGVFARDGAQGHAAGFEYGGGTRGMANASEQGWESRGRPGFEGRRSEGARVELGRLRDASGLANPDGGHAGAERQQRGREQRQQPQDGGYRSVDGELPGPVNGFWREADWLLCRDPDGPRWRPVEPGTFPLAHGSPARVGRLRGYGNAINVEAATAWIEVCRETLEETGA